MPADEEPGNQSPLQSSVPQDDLAATSDGDDSHTPAVAENLAPAVTEEPVGLAGPSWMSDPAPVPVTSAAPVGTSPPLVSPSSPTSSTPPPPLRLKIFSSFYSPQVCITPQAIRPYPKVERPPTQGKGRKRVHACILTEDENALADLRAKDEKKRKAEEKKKASAERKKTSAPRQRLLHPPEPQESTSDDEDLPVVYDDSSDFEEEFEEDDMLDGPYPFVDKEAEVGVYVG